MLIKYEDHINRIRKIKEINDNLNAVDSKKIIFKEDILHIQL